MPRTPNPPEFDQAVDAWLADKREQFNFAQLRHTFLDNDRFHRWARVAARYRPVSGARFLSSGCGPGGSLLAYHDAGAESVTGVEVDADYARLARLRIAGLPAAAVHCVNDERLPFADAAFDLIESMDVIEHVTDPQAYLGELARVLAPDGMILLVTPNRLWPVEQHLGIVGPPWLPVRVGNRLWPALARAPFVRAAAADRYRRVPAVREHNMSMRALRARARRAGLALAAIPRRDHPEDEWPLPRQPAWLEQASAGRFASLIAPVRTLPTLLHHP
jgi:SAM-dependent methyltransferase